MNDTLLLPANRVKSRQFHFFPLRDLSTSVRNVPAHMVGNWRPPRALVMAVFIKLSSVDGRYGNGREDQPTGRNFYPNNPLPAHYELVMERGVRR